MQKKIGRKIIIGFFITLICIGLVAFSADRWDEWWVEIQHFYYSHRYKQVEVTASTVQTYTYTSQVLGGKERSMRIYLPENYDQNQQYPVLYLLTGFPGDMNDFFINTSLQEVLDKLIKEQKLPPMIVVTPDGSGYDVKDSQYVDAELINQNMESYVLEVVHEIDSHFPTIDQREDRAIGGVSSGAYGATLITLHHPEVFSTVISMSGYFENIEWVFPKLIKSKDKIAYNTPLKLVDTVQLTQPITFFMSLGETDYVAFVKQHDRFIEKLKGKDMIHYELTKYPGGHGWPLWRYAITGELEKLGTVWKVQTEQ